MANQPEWVVQSPEEIEELILKLKKEGNSASKIGIILRDQHWIPSVKAATDKKITQILKEHDQADAYPEDLMNFLKENPGRGPIWYIKLN